jgi:hypothetical protein
MFNNIFSKQIWYYGKREDATKVHYYANTEKARNKPYTIKKAAEAASLFHL